MNPAELIANLGSSGRLRCPTGLLLVPQREWETLADWGALRGIDTVLYGEILLRELPEQSRFVSITSESETERLRRIALGGGSPVLLIDQFDIAVSRLSSEDRENLWQNIFTRLTQISHGLLIAMPEGSDKLLPAHNLMEDLRISGRLSAIEVEASDFL